MTHLCRLVPYEKLEDGTLAVHFIDLENNLKVTLKLSASNPILQQTDDMGLIVLEHDWKNGKESYSEIPEILVAIRQMVKKKIKIEFAAILLGLFTIAISLLLTWRT